MLRGIYVTKVWFFWTLKFNNLTDYLSDFVPAKKKSVTLGNPQAIDTDGLLMDVDVQLVNNSSSVCEDKRQDVDRFFHTTIVKEVNGKSKKYRTCKICPWVFASRFCLVYWYSTPGAIRVLSMKSQLCDVILRHVMQYVTFIFLFSTSDPSPV